MKIDDLIKRLDEILQHGDALLKNTYRHEGESTLYVDYAKFYAFKSESLSFIEKHFGSDHPYREEFSKKTVNYAESSAQVAVEILKSIRGEMAGGWLTTVKSLASAEIFSDFLEMAEHLLEADYKDPAAVMIGGVLEEHLRQLCTKNSIDLVATVNNKSVPKMGNSLNDDLAKAGIYNKLDQKSVTAWMDLRNKAAHGKYAEYQKPQVEQMAQGVANFILRNPV